MSWLLPGDHLSSLYDGFNGKRHCEAHLFFILFYVFGTAVCAVSYFTFWTELFLSVGCLQCSVCLLLSIWSVGWKLKSATTFCPCVPFVVIHSLSHCYSRFLFCIILLLELSVCRLNNYQKTFFMFLEVPIKEHFLILEFLNIFVCILLMICSFKYVPAALYQLKTQIHLLKS